MLAAITLAFAAATSTVATSRGDQALTVYAPPGRSRPEAERPMVLVLSGEGGWRAFDEQLATWLAADGYWVGGIDCLKYFWKAQDDRVALANDVMRYADALAQKAGAPKGARVVLAGFSFGADLAPWIAGSPGSKGRIVAMVMIGPDLRGSLEARLVEILGFSPKGHTFDTASALADAASVRALFVHGGKDDSSAAPALAASFGGPKALAVVPDATHHFAGHEADLRRAVIDGLRKLLSR